MKTLLCAAGILSFSLSLVASVPISGRPILNIDFTDENGTKIGPAAIGLSPSDVWNRSITTFNPGTVVTSNLLWSDGTTSTVNLTVQNAPGLWGNGVTNDAMYQDYVYSWDAQPILVTLSGLTNNVYDLYVYGHSPADDVNGLFQLLKNGMELGYRGTTIWGQGWASTNWTEGEQYVVFRNVSAGSGDSLEINVLPVSGYPILSGLQLVPNGALIEYVPQMIQRLINIDASGTQGAKVGPAAIGQTTNDFWNLYQQPWVSYGVLQNLMYADSTMSQATLIVQNSPGYWGFPTPPAPIDAMYDGYTYPFDGGNISVLVTNLPNGIYDLFIYSHAGADDANSVVNVSCANADYGTRGTSIWGSGWASNEWEEGQQYLAFRKVLVVDGQAVQITLSPFAQSTAMLNGIQIAQHAEDSDGDGLPDWWEVKYFGNLDQVGTAAQGSNWDYDHDGLSNQDEYLRGTNPTSADTDADGLSDSEELQILLDTSHPELGYLDPLNSDTGNTGILDGDKDSDHDGISNLKELRKYGSNPATAHTFNAQKNDAEFFFSARPFDLTTMARVDLANLGNSKLQFTISGAFPNATYDLYFVPDISYQRWQWRRVYSGVQCDNAGQAMFNVHQPDPNQGFFVILSAEDQDLDGLTDGYETWFTYNGIHTSPTTAHSDTDQMKDGWEVEYGLNPTVISGNDGSGGNIDGDAYNNKQEHDNYYAAVGGYSGSFDPLKAYNTGANRPVITISDSPINTVHDVASFTVTRNVGVGGTIANALTVYYSVGGSLNYDDGDYSLYPVPTDWPRIYSVTIPAGAASASVTVTPAANAVPQVGKTLVVTITPFGVSPVSQVSDPQSWAYVVDWNHNRMAINFSPFNPLELPKIGDTRLRIIAPDLLELVRITDGDSTTDWNFVVNQGVPPVPVFVPPPADRFQVTVDGTSIDTHLAVFGFKRRILYAPLGQHDFRVENSLYMKLPAELQANANAIEVKNSQADLWPSSLQFIALKTPFRYNPAIHVNQEGYARSYPNVANAPKKAMVGYFLGSLGEMDILASRGFQIVDAANPNSQVYPATPGAVAPLVARLDNGWGEDDSHQSLAQYKKVLEADFSNFNVPGQYLLVVPGLGASFPFRIDDGISMKLTRAYALGLYHQRCGAANVMPFTRFTHDPCHLAPAWVPTPQSLYSTAWGYIAGYANTENMDNPPQIAAKLTNPSAQLYPFQQHDTQGNGLAIDVSLGHHDAGDYSKYTLNSATLIHTLIFAADHFPGVGTLDNLGLPESNETTPIGDILQLAKWEADFLAKMQDTDSGGGGFYFLVYPKAAEYEGSVFPEFGGPQIVWPKTTAASAAAVAALADIGSSPLFKQKYPAAAAQYLSKAQTGWQFLINAIGPAPKTKDGAFQKLTHYGDMFTHDDELAWAAAALFAATDNATTRAQYFQQLQRFFPHPADGHNGFNIQWINTDTGTLPSSGNLLVVIKYTPAAAGNTSHPLHIRVFDQAGIMVADKNDVQVPTRSTQIVALKNQMNDIYDLQAQKPIIFDLVGTIVGQCHSTLRDGWRHCSDSYGCAVRDYAFAARSLSGLPPARRLPADLDSGYLAECETEINAAGNDARTWSEQNSYGTSLPFPTKHLFSPGWYFSGDWAFDIAVADQISPNSANTKALIENFNYEAGRNPVNVSYITGLGWKRQREIVHQYAQADSRTLPPSGIPLGNLADAILGGQLMDLNYAGKLNSISFPLDGGGPASFGLYDRWQDAYNLKTEFVSFQSARALATAALLAASTAAAAQTWSSQNATIDFQGGQNPTLNTPGTAYLTTSLDLSTASTVWEVDGVKPAFGSTLMVKRNTVGESLLEAEAVLPDGRRVFASRSVFVNDPIRGGDIYDADASTIALYRFSGNYNNSIGTSYNLVPSGHVTLAGNTSWMKTPSGQVARFRDVGDYLTVTIPDSVVRPGGSGLLTIEARIYPRAYKGSGATYLLHFAQGSPQEDTYNREWSIYFTGTPNVPQIFGPSAGPLLSQAGWNTYLSPNTWHELRITFDPAAGGPLSSLYVDGAFRGSCNTQPAYSGEDWTLTLGNFDGDMDEVRISKVVR